MKPKQILFLCTGNYYRSRFAELLFNHLAPQNGLPWLATSRGLALELGAHNVGPIAVETVERLTLRGVALPDETRFPLPVLESDLAESDHIVALKRDEHLPLMERSFPRWVERVEFWRVHDRDVALPDETFDDIERNLTELIDRLRSAELIRSVRSGR